MVSDGIEDEDGFFFRILFKLFEHNKMLAQIPSFKRFCVVCRSRCVNFLRATMTEWIRLFIENRICFNLILIQNYLPKVISLPQCRVPRHTKQTPKQNNRILPFIKKKIK